MRREPGKLCAGLEPRVPDRRFHPVVEAMSAIDWHTKQVRKGAALLPPHRTQDERVLFACELPKPISTNALYVRAGAKRRVRSEGYENWLSHAGWKLKLAWRGAAPLRGPLAVTMRVPPGPDIDNNCKAVLDLLTKMSVIVDDRYIVELHVYREEGRATCGVEIRQA
jgi:Holliday junction resolvase RusA-like endonuclease